jgi:hypothetical protein
VGSENGGGPRAVPGASEDGPKRQVQVRRW